MFVLGDLSLDNSIFPELQMTSIQQGECQQPTIGLAQKANPLSSLQIHVTWPKEYFISLQTKITLFNTLPK
jgi:hypothetical protein